jgi:structure-specific recognition protein 1
MPKRANPATKVEKKEKPQKKEKKTKAKKDKNAPKRAISAFFFYQKERRESLKKEQPQLDNKQLISKMSEEWNGMNDAARVPYVKLAEGDKHRYEKEKKEYEKTGKGKSTPAKGSEKKEKSAKKGKKVAESEEENGEDDE